MMVRKKSFENIAWLVILVILFWQSVLQNFSFISNVALFYVAIKQNNKVDSGARGFLAISVTLVIVLFLYSFLRENEVSYAIRFGIILVMLLFSYFWKMTYKPFLTYLFYVSLSLVLALYGLEGYLFSCSNDEYMMFRDHFIIANEMGDVFNYHDIYFKLEVRGTPLIVFVYMLSYITEIFPKKFDKLLKVLYFIGVILAGNFAYQLALIAFHFIHFFFLMKGVSLGKKLVVLIISLFVIGGSLFAFLQFTFKEKSEGSASTRTDQAIVLMDDMTKDIPSCLFGSGLGHTVSKKTSHRDYTGNIYFEVQAFYFLNQLGLPFFSLFIVLYLLLAVVKFKDKRLLSVYAIYIIYASTNPYIFDTNNIVVICTLLCVRKKLIEEERMRSISHTSNTLCTS